MRPGRLADRYGRTALVVGASEGLGAAWSEALAAAGLDLVCVARRPAPLEQLAAELRARHGVAVETIAGDLRRPDFLSERAPGGLAGREIDVVVANAAVAPVGPFLEADPDALSAAVEVNALGAVRLARSLLPPMAERGRGAFVLMSSLAGLQGSPRLATYAATKGFLRVFAEGLWSELRPFGVDVLACVAGAVATPGYAATASATAPGTLEPPAVVEAALRALGRRPVVVPGATNKLAAVAMGRLLPRRSAVAVMAAANRTLG